MRRRSAAFLSAAALALLVSLGLARAASPALSFASLLGLGEERCEGRASWEARNPGMAGKCLPPVPELDCGDGVDNDSDEMTDQLDPDCEQYFDFGGSYVPQTCAATEADLDGDCVQEMSGCTDAYDNDANGSIDCEDGACAGRGACAGVQGSGVAPVDPDAGVAKNAEDIAGSPADLAKKAAAQAKEDGTAMTPEGYICDFDGSCEGAEFYETRCPDCQEEQNELMNSICDKPENDGLTVNILEGTEATPLGVYRCAYGIAPDDPDYIGENLSLEVKAIRPWTLCHDGIDNDRNGDVDCRDDACYGLTVAEQVSTNRSYDEDGQQIEGFDAALDREQNPYIYEDAVKEVGCYCGDGECTTNFEDSLLCPEDCG